MAFSTNAGSGPMAEINIIPLADVMLVLLIIFMVTAPPTTYEISVDLPQRSTQPPPPTTPKDPIKLRIDASGQVYWNGTLYAVSQLQPMMREVVQQDPTNQPTLEIDTDPNAEYGVLAKVLAAAKNAQMVKIGFVQAD
ncbi:MAG TPA: biopolymer transporter ExbD [Xanthomonadaceae bacterium]|nr:biopolymer transporter ExbD [Xanthomonadaceae bacterium]